MKPGASLRLLSSPTFAWFAFGGAIGFIVDAAILTVLSRIAGWPLFWARACSFGVAVTVTWLINRRLAFAGGSRFRARAEYAGYFFIQLVGAAINLCVFAICIFVVPSMKTWPVIPLAIGAGAALSFNFLITRSALYTARGSRPTPED